MTKSKYNLGSGKQQCNWTCIHFCWTVLEQLAAIASIYFAVRVLIVSWTTSSTNTCSTVEHWSWLSFPIHLTFFSALKSLHMVSKSGLKVLHEASVILSDTWVNISLTRNEFEEHTLVWVGTSMLSVSSISKISPLLNGDRLASTFCATFP